MADDNDINTITTKDINNISYNVSGMTGRAGWGFRRLEETEKQSLVQIISKKVFEPWNDYNSHRIDSDVNEDFITSSARALKADPEVQMVVSFGFFGFSFFLAVIIQAIITELIKRWMRS